ncbi:MAG: tetratricopeptide repeat protein [Candidatus Eisenbacteria bacterium]|uniref:Tetratricopeptide repeat protein n=1 Tax=Eiseniibacteriota bacterium TaxID=2212470 RepID=A0A948W5F9_UNCEI|nr:tetratricopeptide repeat protein [Candidatus Eisenbacteria bacterium]MBU1947789.1 tetratricopeptide repeat protein [Candidatus Eisenbacteria bacterium]MBU2689546.1 tetratricopeptide repeat protein [Candidatus Eisenbacteria bacterium]
MRLLKILFLLIVAVSLSGLMACKSAHISGGKLHFDQRRFERALEQFQLAIIEQPDNGEAYMYLGLTEAELKHPEEADAALKKAVELMPELGDQITVNRLHYWTELHNDALRLAGEGNVLRDDGDEAGSKAKFNEALKQFQIATIYAPEQLDTHIYIGKLRYQLGETDAAIAIFTNVQKMAAEQMANAQNAAEAQKKQEDVNGLLVAVYWDLANKAYQTERWDDAIRFYHNVMEITPDEPDLLYQLAGSYFQKALNVPKEEKTEYLREAANFYQKVVDRVATDEDALYNMTVALWDLGEYVDAEVQARKLVDINSKDGEYRILLGRILSKLDKKEEFVAEFVLGKALSDSRPETAATVRDEATNCGPKSDMLDALRNRGEPEEVRRFTDSSGQEYVCWFYWTEGKAYAFVNCKQQFQSEFKASVAGD